MNADRGRPYRQTDRQTQTQISEFWGFHAGTLGPGLHSQNSEAVEVFNLVHIYKYLCVCVCIYTFICIYIESVCVCVSTPVPSLWVLWCIRDADVLQHSVHEGTSVWFCCMCLQERFWERRTSIPSYINILHIIIYFILLRSILITWYCLY
jgi:hypothetical protein